MADRCSEPRCNLPAKAVIELRRVCLTHFLEACYQRLDELSKNTRDWSYGGPAWESARRITNECAQKAADYSQLESGLSNLERARLLDITLQAAELGRRLRRSPRSAIRMSVLLISEMSGRCWCEETHTVDVSRHGTQTLCNHPVEIDDILKVLWLDTAGQVDGRVVWHRKNPSGSHEIGIEFLQGGSKVTL